MHPTFKKNQDIPVGCLMERKNGKRYQVVAAPSPAWVNGCKACAFETKSLYFCRNILCEASKRKDGMEVVFVRRKDLEKDPERAPEPEV